MLLQFLIGHILDILSLDNGLYSMILLEGLLYQVNQHLYALLEIHHISFVILKDIRDDGSHYLAVALAVDCSQVDQLGHIEDPVVIDHLVVKL